MELRELLPQVAAQPEPDRGPVYPILLSSTLFVWTVNGRFLVAVHPAAGYRAVPAFFSAAEANEFGRQLAGDQVKGLAEAVSFGRLAKEARSVGRVVIDPTGTEFVLNHSELSLLAAGEIPGALTAWLRDLRRVERGQAEIAARLRASSVHTITGKGPDGLPRLYLLEKSEDGTLAVPCFSSAESLAQFARVRALATGTVQYGVAVITGARCLEAAAGLGAYVLIDPESPWETQLEPSLY